MGLRELASLMRASRSALQEGRACLTSNLLLQAAPRPVCKEPVNWLLTCFFQTVASLLDVSRPPVRFQRASPWNCLQAGTDSNSSCHGTDNRFVLLLAQKSCFELQICLPACPNPQRLRCRGAGTQRAGVPPTEALGMQPVPWPAEACLSPSNGTENHLCTDSK